MRILASNPDSIGDLVLRQPMYDALVAAGHELLVVVRSFNVPIARLVVPRAKVLQLDSNPYSPAFDSKSYDVTRILDAAQEFAPDIFCLAPYQRTQFEELLGKSLKQIRIVGMSGILYRGDINVGLDQLSDFRFDDQVTVARDISELRKNELLCGAILGRSIELPNPKIVPDARQIELAAIRLRQLGLAPGGFWIVSAGHNQYTAIRNWSTINWAHALSHSVREHSWKLLFVGTTDEHEAVEEIRKYMGNGSSSTENICGVDSLDTLVGLIHMSAGYIGRDTGPMHLAAAMGKQVISLFGGGTWPRFMPAAETGVALTVAVPCAGCDWVCNLQQSYCIKSVRPDAVIEAIDDIQAGRVQGTQLQQDCLSPSLTARLIREGADTSREIKRRLADSETHNKAQGRQLEQLGTDLGALRESLSFITQERDGLMAQHRAEVERAGILQSTLLTERAQSEKEKASLLDILKDMREELSSVMQQRENLMAQHRTDVELTGMLQSTLRAMRIQLESEKGSLLDILKDMREELSSVTQEREKLMAQHQSELERASQSEMEKADMVNSLNGIRKELKTVTTLVENQRWQIEQFRQSLGYLAPTAVRRIFAARGRRFAEAKTVFRWALPVLRKKLELTND
jgi:ADP-heptose:LPS heptosyltransferase